MPMGLLPRHHFIGTAHVTADEVFVFRCAGVTSATEGKVVDNYGT
jgi:hypothetical protein